MTSLESIQTYLDRELPALVKKHGVPAAGIAVLFDGEIVDSAAGVVSTATKVEANTETVFQIGSITKVWTATLVMQLVDEGLVELDAPIQRYLTDFRVRDEAASASITVRQLLSHRAGFEGDVFTDTGDGDDAIQKFVESIADLQQLFTPGEYFSYCNSGYIVLGRLVEKFRGTTWDQALLDHIATPLGLTHVSIDANHAILHRAAVGHVGVGEDGVETPAPFWSMQRSGAPAGSRLAMTARDLVGFAKMHIADGVAPDGTVVVSKASAAAMREPQVFLPRLTGMGEAWGLGWEVMSNKAPFVIGHDGSTIGQSSYMQVVPGAGAAVALLTNGGDSVALFQEIFGAILKDIAGVELASWPTPVAEPSKVDASPFTGVYSSSLIDLTVSQDDDGRVWLDQSPKGELIDMGEEGARFELVGYGPDSLIQREPMRGMHPVYAFMGDAGEGKRRYINFGRIIAREAKE